MRGSLFWVWLGVSVLWIGAVAYWGLENRPVMSLDLGNDEGTRAAFDRAAAWHAGVCALIALVPPALVLLLGRAVSRN